MIQLTTSRYRTIISRSSKTIMWRTSQCYWTSSVSASLTLRTISRIRMWLARTRIQAAAASSRIPSPKSDSTKCGNKWIKTVSNIIIWTVVWLLYYNLIPSWVKNVDVNCFIIVICINIWIRYRTKRVAVTHPWDNEWVGQEHLVDVEDCHHAWVI